MTTGVNELFAIMAERNPDAFVMGLEAARIAAKRCSEVGVEVDLDPEGEVYSMAVNEVLKDDRSADLTEDEFTVAGVAIIVGFKHEIEKQGAQV